MIYARKRGKICIYQKVFVSLHGILKRRYKELRNYEGEVDKYRG